METSSIISQVSQLAATVGAFVWLTKRNMAGLDALKSQVSDIKTDIAVIKTQVLTAVSVARDVKEDHDKLILTEQRVDQAEKDLDALHGKMRVAKK